MGGQQCVEIGLSSRALLLEPVHFLIGLTDKVVSQQRFDVVQLVRAEVVGEQLQQVQLDGIELRSGHYQEKVYLSNLQKSPNRIRYFLSNQQKTRFIICKAGFASETNVTCT